MQYVRKISDYKPHGDVKIEKLYTVQPLPQQLGLGTVLLLHLGGEHDGLGVGEGQGGELAPGRGRQPPGAQQHAHPLHPQLPAPVLRAAEDTSPSPRGTCQLSPTCTAPRGPPPARAGARCRGRCGGCWRRCAGTRAAGPPTTHGYIRAGNLGPRRFG